MEGKPLGYLIGPDGNKSSSRLIAVTQVVFALFLSGIFSWIGVKWPDVDLMKIALAIGVVYGSIAAPAYIFLFGQKKTEVKMEDVIQNTNKPELIQ